MTWRATSLLVALLAVPLLAGCHSFRKDLPRETVLSDRRVTAMQTLLARPADQGLIDRDQSLLVIHEKVIEKLLTAALPFEQRVAGQIIVRLEAVAVDFDDGVPILHLEGTAAPTVAKGKPPHPATLTVAVEGVIESIVFEPERGILRARARVLAVESHRTGVKADGWRGFVSEVVRLQSRSFEGVNYDIEIPIRVIDRITLPDLANDDKPSLPVTIEPASIPLDVSVGEPTALFDRLWIPIHLLSGVRLDSTSARTGPVHEMRPGRPKSRRGKAPRPPLPTDLESTLRDSLDRAVRADPVLVAIMGKEDQVTVATSQRLLNALIEQVADDYLDRVDVMMDADIVEDETGALAVGTPVGRVTAGKWSIWLRVETLRGRLKAGRPRVQVGREGEVAIRVPTRIETGGGRLTLDFAWKPKKLVSILCRGFRDTVSVTAKILPQEHELVGTVRFTDGPEGLRLDTTIRRDRHPIAMTLSDSSWAAVRASLAEQDKFSRCGMLLDPDDALEKLKSLGAAGIRIRMPERLFPSVTLPTRVAKSVLILDKPVALVAGPNKAGSKGGVIWSSADIGVLPTTDIIPPESRKEGGSEPTGNSVPPNRPTQ
ncbi:MAG TPA: hypothetical protein VF720_15515 [Candidatus Eisenbacteria bacterium]